MKLIAQGAEAKIYDHGGMVVKDRFSKKYRHPEIDSKLRKFRTKREAKVLDKLSTVINVPKILRVEECKIGLERIFGKKIRDCFSMKLCSKIGEMVGKMHSIGIIHGDLTTSNMILSDSGKEDSRRGNIYFIDFGLSFFSEKLEDKAVDLHLLNRAMISKHFEVYEMAWKEIIKGYKKECVVFLDVMQRFELVEKRGRNKLKH